MPLSTKQKLLLVEDDASLQYSLSLVLKLQKYAVCTSSQIGAAKHLLKEKVFDLVILDLSLPDGSGLDLLNFIKLNYPQLSVLILSAQNSSQVRVAGLKQGADDFLNKPFDIDELLLRIQKIIQRKKPLVEARESVLVFGKNKLFVEQMKAQNFDKKIFQLNKTEVEILKFFLHKPNQAQRREDIFKQAYPKEYKTNTRSIDNVMLRFRKIFEPMPSKPIYFVSVRGVGYMLRSSK